MKKIFILFLAVQTLSAFSQSSDSYGGDLRTVDVLVPSLTTLYFNPEDPADPLEGDILFSEIMANPASGDPEYVELYNASSKTLSLKGSQFCYGTNAYNLPDKTVAPHSYFVLCKTSAVATFNADVTVFGVTSFPTLANTGKLLMIKGKNDQLISWFEYTDKMYNDDAKKGGGWSLECIDLANISSTAANWSASVHASGGTPGKVNSIQAPNPDTVRPALVSSVRTDNQTIQLTFSKPMNRSDLLNPNTYSIENANYAVTDRQINFPQATEITLTLNAFPPQGSFFEIVFFNLHDLSGNELDSPNFILIGEGHEANPNDLVINEILFNPPTGGNEYVEIYNRSDKMLDLRSLSITSRKPSDGSFNKLYPLAATPLFLFPEEYLVITKNRDLVCNFFECDEESRFVELAVMPSLANTSGCAVILNNKTDEIVDEFAYNENMHSPGLSSKKGVALERIDFNKPATAANNWASAKATSGYGTPGYINSQSSPGTSLSNQIQIEYPSVEVDGYKINYQTDRAGYKCRIYIYDSTGRLVDTLLNNTLTGTKGEISWNSKGLSGGIYILYVELYDPVNGNVKKIKTPVIVR